MKTISPTRTALLLLALQLKLFPLTTCAADYMGATAVLKQLSEKQTAGTNAVAEVPSVLIRLKRDTDAFKKELPDLRPEEAAQKWLTLLDRQLKLSPEELTEAQMTPSQMHGENSTNTFNPQDIWNALPGPASWEALCKFIEARPLEKGKKAVSELALRMFAHTLTADHGLQTNDLAMLEAIFKKLDDNEKYSLANVLDEINQIMVDTSGDADTVLKSLERQLIQTSESDFRDSLEVPDLVTLVGKEKAEAFLRKALVKPKIELEINQGIETKKLARTLALKLINQLKHPQWKLAQSLDALELFEAMEKQFPATETAETNEAAVDMAMPREFRAQLARYGDERGTARTYYLLGLIVAGRTVDAVALAEKLGKVAGVSLPEEALKELDRAGHTLAIHDFFSELLAKNPDLPYWQEYIPLAARVGQTEKMLALARKNAERTDLSDARRNLIRNNLFQALLAADRVEEGVKELQQILDTKPEEGDDDSTSEKASLALRLAKLGKLLDQPAWTEAGIRQAREAIFKSPNITDSYQYAWVLKELTEFLVENGRGPEAESVVVEALVKESKRKKPAAKSWNQDQGGQTVALLAAIYASDGRHADVIALLDQSPQWNGKDLAELMSGYRSLFFATHKENKENSLGYITARALAALDRKSEARKIVDALLDKDGGFDPGYELMIELGGADLFARLDALFARDQFEERPLIWKAELLRRAGRLEEAEATVHRAISIDPSDGEQGPGDRMRAYAVLAEICAARGDTNQATFFRGAVTAIRHSENADRYFLAGLLKQAVQMYEESLTHFADAYCIQSRLALQLSELGLHEAAEEHYRRAYELMPESFGRVESHCFGCERAFDGERAQSVAEKVFTRLAQTTPDKPQVHYLLGFLREEQGRNDEALTHYRQAVKLDPDYLNAWKHIQSVGEQQHLPTADENAVAVNLLRLDPLDRHDAGRNFSKVTDLRQLWTAVEAAAKVVPPKPDSLYPLAASKARMEKEASSIKDDSRERFTSDTFYSRDRDSETLQPARAILQNKIIAALLPLLGGNSYSRYGGMEF